MLGDDNNSDMIGRQMRGMVLIALMMMGWFYFFPPEPPVQPNTDTAEPIEVPLDDGRVAPVVADTIKETPVAKVTDATLAVQWPNLPVIPTDSTPELDEVIIEDENLRLVFTKIGGRLKQAEVILGEVGELNSKLIPIDLEKSDVDA